MSRARSFYCAFQTYAPLKRVFVLHAVVVAPVKARSFNNHTCDRLRTRRSFDNFQWNLARASSFTLITFTCNVDVHSRHSEFRNGTDGVSSFQSSSLAGCQFKNRPTPPLCVRRGSRWVACFDNSAVSTSSRFSTISCAELVVPCTHVQNEWKS